MEPSDGGLFGNITFLTLLSYVLVALVFFLLGRHGNPISTIKHDIKEKKTERRKNKYSEY